MIISRSYSYYLAKLLHNYMHKINIFEDTYYMLSNWSAHKIKIWGKVFATADHAYHYKKFEKTSPTIAQQILKAPSPMIAKDIASAHRLAVDPKWEDKKLKVYKSILHAKLKQHNEVKKALVASKTCEIVEDSPYDSYWGTGADGRGLNMLGKLWMELREDLLAKTNE